MPMCKTVAKNLRFLKLDVRSVKSELFKLTLFNVNETYPCNSLRNDSQVTSVFQENETAEVQIVSKFDNQTILGAASMS